MTLALINYLPLAVISCVYRATLDLMRVGPISTDDAGATHIGMQCLRHPDPAVRSW